MKSYIQLVVVALVLFSASAAMSVWLNQAGKATDTPATAPDAKAPHKLDDKHAEKHADKPAEKADPKGGAKPDHGPGPDANALLALRDREAKLERRQAQMDLILRDLQAQREAHDTLSKAVAAEVKLAATKATDTDAKLADIQKKQAELDAIERKNIEKMASMYDTMAPESAARIVQQMADSGKLDTAVKILGQMKERQAARVLAELPDATLAAQLLDKLRVLKRPPKTPAAP